MANPLVSVPWARMGAFLQNRSDFLGKCLSDYRSLKLRSVEEVVDLLLLERRFTRAQRASRCWDDANLLSLLHYFVTERQEIVEEGDATIEVLYQGPLPPPEYYGYLVEKDAERLADVDSFIIFLRRHAFAPHG